MSPSEKVLPDFTWSAICSKHALKRGLRSCRVITSNARSKGKPACNNVANWRVKVVNSSVLITLPNEKPADFALAGVASAFAADSSV